MGKAAMAVLLALALAGCATTAKYQAQLNSWVGSPEQALVQQWGIPDGSYEADGSKYLIYAAARSVYLPPAAPGYAGANVHHRCKTVFSVRDGRIESWTYEGNACRTR